MAHKFLAECVEQGAKHPAGVAQFGPISNTSILLSFNNSIWFLLNSYAGE